MKFPKPPQFRPISPLSPLDGVLRDPGDDGGIPRPVPEPQQNNATVLLRESCLSGFNPLYYLSRQADVGAYYGVTNIPAAINHYYTSGIKEGRSPSPFFEPIFYLNYHKDVSRAYDTDETKEIRYILARNHWITHGIGEGRRGSPYFDVHHYLYSSGDLLQAFGSQGFTDAANHWVTKGWSEPRATASDGRLSVLPYIGPWNSHEYQLTRLGRPDEGGGGGRPSGTTWRADGILEIAEKVKDFYDVLFNRLFAETKNKIMRLLDDAKERVGNDHFAHSADRLNFEAEHYEQMRDMLMA